MPIEIIPIAKAVNIMAMIQSVSPIEIAAKSERNWFIATVAWVVVTALGTALLTVLLYRKTGKYQDALKAESYARIATADSRAAQANAEAAKANEGLGKSNEEIARLTKEAEEAKTERAEADRQIAAAKADAAQATQRTAEISVRVESEARKRAEAERALLELQQRIKDRHLTPEQKTQLINELTAGAKGKIDVSCIGGNPEPCAFASELVDVLEKSGWIVKLNPGIMILGGTPSGLIIRVQNATQTPARASVLQQALTRTGISAPGTVVPDFAPDAVELLVGSKPSQ